MRLPFDSFVRLGIGIIIAIVSLASYIGSREFNPVTGETQFVALSAEQEIALGLQAAPQVAREFGGLLNNAQVQNRIDQIGARLVNTEIPRGTPWQFDFSVLDSPDTVNAFALPGGPIFITSALLRETTREDQVAAVLAHEMVHVLARHGSQQIAASELTNGLVGAVAVASGRADATTTAAIVGQLMNLRYGRTDEIQSDTLGVCLLIDAEYDPMGMAEVMQILAEASRGSIRPEFFSTHPSPDNRIQRIERAIDNAARECP